MVKSVYANSTADIIIYLGDLQVALRRAFACF